MARRPKKLAGRFERSNLMATRDQVRNAMHRQPFRGFTVRLVDGRSFHIKHPDFISVSEQARGRHIVIHDKGTHHLDLLLIVEVEEPEDTMAPASPAKSEGD
jgi:hypothetical protein